MFLLRVATQSFYTNFLFYFIYIFFFCICRLGLICPPLCRECAQQITYINMLKNKCDSQLDVASIMMKQTDIFNNNKSQANIRKNIFN